MHGTQFRAMGCKIVKYRKIDAKCQPKIATSMHANAGAVCDMS